MRPDYRHADHTHRYMEVYTNPEITTWEDDFKQPFPKNRFLGQC
jgi:beta-glucan synthesis-associated protein KRE6